MSGTSYEEALYVVRREYRVIQKRTPRRQPYIRSKYFSNDKVFINNFLNHLVQKRKGEQIKRAKLFACALDLLRHTTLAPTTIISQRNPNELLHRFTGQTKDSQKFYVQVKQNAKNGRKDFMSVFGAKK